MRAPATEAPGTSGASYAKANFEQLGWGVAESSTHDLGTDLFLMARDSRRAELGLLVGVQVKSGLSAFGRPPKRPPIATCATCWTCWPSRAHSSTGSSHPS